MLEWVYRFKITVFYWEHALYAHLYRDSLAAIKGRSLVYTHMRGFGWLPPEFLYILFIIFIYILKCL